MAEKANKDTEPDVLSWRSLSIAEVAEVLQKTPAEVERLLDEGSLPEAACQRQASTVRKA